MDLLDDYAEWMRSWGAASRTIDARLTVAKSRLKAWGLDGFTPPNIQTWLASPSIKSPWSRLTYYGHLASFTEWLTATGRLPADPMLRVRKPAPTRSVPRPLADVDVERVLAEASGDMRAWVLLALLQGLRAHEIAKLRGEDVGPDDLYVHGKGGKQAILPTHPQIWELAESYPRRGYWFPYRDGHMPARLVSLRVGRLFDSLGLEGSLHRLRHTYGTRLLRAGVHIRRVQKLMRHANLATTAAYTAVDEDELRAAIRLLSA